MLIPNPHPGAPARPSTLQVLRARERAPTPYFSAVFSLDSHLSPLKSLGVCHEECNKFNKSTQFN